MKKNLLYYLLFIGTCSYAQIPAGYYDNASGKSGYQLKTALYNIIDDHTTQTYASLWGHFEDTDKRADGKVWDMYANCNFTFVTDQDGGTGGTSECQKFNREHSFPASWFDDASPMYTDLFQLYPTDKKVNNERGNLPFGDVASAAYTSGNGSKRGTSAVTISGYSGNVFEPADEYKGDFARTYFYMATRYENVISGWQNNSTESNAVLDGSSDKVFETWLLTILYQWHKDDPVSTKETDRNNAVYGIQGNRNPYIDHPEWVNEVWQLEATPSNPTIQFAAQSASVTEGNTTTINLQISPAYTSSFSVILSLTNGNGVQYNVDYQTSPAVSSDKIVLNVPANATSTSFSLTALDDNAPEASENIAVEIISSGDVLIGTNSNITVTLEDNDGGVTALEDEWANSTVLYPNPAKNVVFIKSEISQLCEVTISDLTGKILSRQSVNNAIDTGMLNKGLYIVQFVKDGYSFSKKIYIQ